MSVDHQSLTLSEVKFGHASVTDGEFLYVLGGSNNALLGDIEMIDLNTNQVSVLKGKITPRRYFSAVFDGNESIYIFGGMSLKGWALWFNPSIEVFNTKTKQTTQLDDFTLPTRINAAVLHENTIYVIGGDRPSDWGLVATNRMFAFDLETQKWRSMPDMPSAKATNAVVYQDYIYVVGGYNNDTAMDVFERYDIKNGRWESLPALPRVTSANSIAVIDNKLFSFGDYQELDLSMVYDFDTQTWRQVNLGFLPTRHAAITSHNNTIYVTGGTRRTRNGAIDLIQTIQIN